MMKGEKENVTERWWNIGKLREGYVPYSHPFATTLFRPLLCVIASSYKKAKPFSNYLRRCVHCSTVFPPCSIESTTNRRGGVLKGRLYIKRPAAAKVQTAYAAALDLALQKGRRVVVLILHGHKAIKVMNGLHKEKI